jgi:hypothetical protein
VTHTDTGKINVIITTAWHFVLDMKAWLKIDCSQYFVKRAKAKLSKSFDKFKIAPLEAEAQLPKL